MNGGRDPSEDVSAGQVSASALLRQLDDLSDEAVREAKRYLLDSLGCALGGFQQHDVHIALQVLRENGGQGPATVIGTGHWTDPVTASLLNALMVRVMVAVIGFASVIVKVRAKRSSTQLNMKQKKAVTPTPARISGMKMVIKKRGKPYPSIKAVSSISFGIPDIKPSKIQMASGTLNRQWARATAIWVSIRLMVA